jgi:hypothetical protein
MIRTLNTVLGGKIPANKAGAHKVVNGDGFLHSTTEPALVIEYKVGNTVEREEYWFRQGILWRTGDLPAVTLRNGDREWYVDGKHYRSDGGPCIQSADNRKVVYYDSQGRMHRTDGPARVWDGQIEYYVAGKLHRDRNDGPASYHQTMAHGDKYYEHGIEVGPPDE